MSMQHHYWITKQTLARKLGRKDDECIVSSDAELDTKLELFRNIQVSCNVIQRVVDRYQETNCILSQEQSSMGRFLNENSEQDKTKAGEVMLLVGKTLVYCAQQQLLLHEPLLRWYREVETFRQRAIADTLQNVLLMERARTEYRAALNWMKDVSQELDPDTTKQLEKFKKVQNKVRRGKANFDKLAIDCSQKVDLLAAARCNMLNHALTFYQNKILEYAKKSAHAYAKLTGALQKQSDTSCKIEPKKEIVEEKKENIPQEVVEGVKNEELQEKKEEEESNESVLSALNWEASSASEQTTSQDLLVELNSIFNSNLGGEVQNEFMPSNLLSLKSQDNTGKKFFNFGSKDSEKSEKGQKATSWLSLFKDLDPLEGNSIHGAEKSKDSFV